MSEIEGAAASFGLHLQPVGARVADDLEPAFVAAANAGAQAMVQLTDGLRLNSYRARIAELAIRYQLPGLYPSRESVDAGGLMAFGPSYSALFRRGAEYVERRRSPTALSSCAPATGVVTQQCWTRQTDPTTCFMPYLTQPVLLSSYWCSAAPLRTRLGRSQGDHPPNHGALA
jgi:hypothetical protein